MIPQRASLEGLILHTSSMNCTSRGLACINWQLGPEESGQAYRVWPLPFGYKVKNQEAKSKQDIWTILWLWSVTMALTTTHGSTCCTAVAIPTRNVSPLIEMDSLCRAIHTLTPLSFSLSHTRLHPLHWENRVLVQDGRQPAIMEAPLLCVAARNLQLLQEE